MHYRVTATLKAETAPELHRKLLDGTIRSQKPDGGAMNSALNQAILTESGRVVFSIGCLCSTPLAHERATVLDEHFDHMEIEQISASEQYEGRSFMEHLDHLIQPSTT